MTKPGRNSPEIRERAVRMMFEHQVKHDSQWVAGFLDTVFHLATRAVRLVVEGLVLALQVDHQITGIAAFFTVFDLDLDDNAAFAVPAAGGVLEPGKAANPGGQPGIVYLRIAMERRYLSMESLEKQSLEQQHSA